MEPNTEMGRFVMKTVNGGCMLELPHDEMQRAPPRVACFIDIPNLETSAYQEGSSFDPSAIKRMAQAEGRIVVARAYGLASLSKPISRGVLAATQAGFEFIPRVLFEEGRKDIDTKMVSDIVELVCIDEVDVFVIASGDSDFIPAVRLAHKRGKRVVVVAVQDCCSGTLLNEADHAFLLSKDNIDELRSVPQAILESIPGVER